MDFERMLDRWTEALDRAVDKSAPWLMGFTVLYFAGHLAVALAKGWL